MKLIWKNLRLFFFFVYFFDLTITKPCRGKNSSSYNKFKTNRQKSRRIDEKFSIVLLRKLSTWIWRRNFDDLRRNTIQTLRILALSSKISMLIRLDQNVNEILNFLSLTEIFILDYGIFQVQLGFFKCCICH